MRKREKKDLQNVAWGAAVPLPWLPAPASRIGANTLRHWNTAVAPVPSDPASALPRAAAGCSFPRLFETNILGGGGEAHSRLKSACEINLHEPKTSPLVRYFGGLVSSHR